MKHILALSAGTVHPPLAGRFRLRRLINGLEGIRTDWTAGIEDLCRLPEGKYDALLLYLHRQTISGKALSTLTEFIRTGGGVLALHSATASFKTRPDYFDILGGKFAGHGPVSEFTCRETGHDFTRGIGDFTLRDELYRHEMTGPVEVLYTAEDDTGEHPAAWLRSFGAGRVFYLVAGHRASAFANPAVRRLVARAADWVCGGKPPV